MTKSRHATASGLLIAVLVLVGFPRRARAAVRESIIVDVQTGTILYSHNADTPAHPASLTKLMTLFLTFHRLAGGRLKLSDDLDVSAHAAAQQPTKLWLRPGSTITVRSAILGITTRSANDAAVVLAEALGGSESSFAQEMNREASQLGMTNTHFDNASGLPDPQQWTSAHDMARLAIALIHDYPAYYGFFSARSFKFHGHIIYGHDHVLDEFPGADGLKTGYIRASGYNLVSSAVRNGRRLVGVVLGGRTAHARDMKMVALLSRGFSTRSTRVLEASSKAPVVKTPVATAPRVKPAVEVVKASAGPVEAATEAGQFEASNFVIQIGGNFSSQHSVRRVLRSAIKTAPGLLSTGGELVVKLYGRHYRARFRRLDEQQAVQACLALHHHGFSCRIVAGESPTKNDLAGIEMAPKAQTD